MKNWLKGSVLAVLRKRNRLIALITEELEQCTSLASELAVCNCIIYQQSFYSKAVQITNVINIVVSTLCIICHHIML
jgi:hypothetical protein